MTTIYRVLFLSFMAFLTVGAACERQKSVENARTLPDKPNENGPVTAGKSSDLPIDLKVELRDDGIFLNIKNIPADSALECSMSTIKVDPCHDGALIAKPAPGDYDINVTANKAGATISAASVKVTILPANAGGGADVVSLAQQPLGMIIDDVNFLNGMAIKRSEDLLIKFRFINKPECQPEVRCNYDSRTTAMWPLCDSPSSKTISKSVMAAGLQFLTIQATCPGVIGPKLELFWYGVPDNYEPLMIQKISDTTNRSVFTLIRSEDCPESMITWKCSEPNQQEFKSCEKGNVIEAPQKGFRIRAVCSSKDGPVYSI